MKNEIPNIVEIGGIKYVALTEELPLYRLVEWFRENIQSLKDDEIEWRGNDCVYLAERYRISISEGFIDFGILGELGGINHTDECYLISSFLQSKLDEFENHG